MTIDDHFMATNSVLPEFGGLWHDRGWLVVRITAPVSISAVRNALQQAGFLQRAERVRRRFDEGRVVLQIGGPNFGALRQLHDSLLADDVPEGLVLSDLDEVRGTVRLGMDSEAAAIALQTRLASIANRVSVFVVDIRPATDLRDHARPIPAGFRIESIAHGCSLGPNGYHYDSDGEAFVTASHCSAETFVLDGDTAYQHELASGHAVAVEIADPDPVVGTSAPCNTTLGCRWSDAAAFAYLSEDIPLRGYVARTQRIGGTTISSSTPNFEISEGSTDWVAVGDSVNRVGITTGWQHGEVTATCVNLFDWVFAGLTLACQDETDAPGDFGDSGGPVFTWDGSGGTVVLVGIVTGGRFENNEPVGSVYSRWYLVEWELGFMEVTAP